MTSSHEHDHECDCGCECGIYPPYISVGTVGFILVAISMLVSGLTYIVAYTHDGSVYFDPSVGVVCQYIYVITAICLLVVSAYGLHKGIYAESLLFVIYAVFTFMMAYASGDIAISDDAMRMVDILMGILMFLPMIVFIIRKEGILALGVFAYAFGLILTEIIHVCDGDASVLSYGITSVIAGVLFAYIAVANLIYAESGYVLPLV